MFILRIILIIKLQFIDHEEFTCTLQLQVVLRSGRVHHRDSLQVIKIG